MPHHPRPFPTSRMWHLAQIEISFRQASRAQNPIEAGSYLPLFFAQEIPYHRIVVVSPWLPGLQMQCQNQALARVPEPTAPCGKNSIYLALYLPMLRENIELPKGSNCFTEVFPIEKNTTAGGVALYRLCSFHVSVSMTEGCVGNVKQPTVEFVLARNSSARRPASFRGASVTNGHGREV
ncbi:hypothetical protein LMG29542_08288 [Paraburkholderia humisilvae]|uniref:Uncharacterized protein n=1 Tax=Paraburkholderia humisilvae TaxID=627669 RepID=A0A6J5FCB9_9BURK|nr:hypothetical protein LMG29542_08288 [Paraburkholderia humisilvae]